MANRQEKYYKQCKKPKYKILPFEGNSKDMLSNILMTLPGLPVIGSILTPLVGEEMKVSIALSAACLLVVMIVCCIKKEVALEPYKATKNFVGLLCPGSDFAVDVGDKISDTFIPRVDELKFIKEELDKLEDKQETNRSICLIGESGCGKSTLLRLFQKTYPSEYMFFECNVDEQDLQSKITTLDDKRNLGAEKQAVFIFDQFEIYFSLSTERQTAIKCGIQQLFQENIIVIFAFRNEYFTQMMLEFNPNHLEKGKGMFFNKKGMVVVADGEPLTDNIMVCLEVLETGIAKLMDCSRKAFKERSEEIYKRVGYGPLIRQQIILNMLECENDKDHDLDKILKLSDKEQMNKYFDHQLCSTEDYFLASRIMYLLSIAHCNHLILDKADLKRALNIKNHSRQSESFEAFLGKMCEIQLLKQGKESHSRQYDVAHDFIAEKFLDYANTEMDADVRAALDEYKTKYESETFQSISDSDGTEAPKEKIKHVYEKGAYILPLILSVAVFILASPLKAGYSVWIVYLMALASFGYFFGLQYHIVRHYVGRKRGLIEILFWSVVVSGLAAVYWKDLWLVFLGIGNSLIGLEFWILSVDSRLSPRVRELYKKYGQRVVLMGILLVVLSRWLDLGTFQTFLGMDMKFLLQVVAMCVLLIYGYTSHLNEKYYYKFAAPLAMAGYIKNS